MDRVGKLVVFEGWREFRDEVVLLEGLAPGFYRRLRVNSRLIWISHKATNSLLRLEDGQGNEKKEGIYE